MGIEVDLKDTLDEVPAKYIVCTSHNIEGINAKVCAYETRGYTLVGPVQVSITSSDRFHFVTKEYVATMVLIAEPEWASID